MQQSLLLLLLALLWSAGAGDPGDLVVPAQYLRHHRIQELSAAGQARRSPPVSNHTEDQPVALYPAVTELATDAIISVNATCGETGPEYYCRPMTGECDVCDASNPDLSKRHPIQNAIDGTDSWWQSPTLKNGPRYEWVTIVINLRHVYEVSSVTVRAAISSLPVTWILERSDDGANYQPWQYFAGSDTECWERFRVRPSVSKLRYRADDEVLCTSIYAKATDQIEVSLEHGRPGYGPDGQLSAALRQFTRAQFIRIRMQAMRRLPQADSNRLFYSLRDISVRGRCVCHGHADQCAGTAQCQCQHNTCGAACDKCCPLFNQQPWRPGVPCQACQCHGHADQCHYDAEQGAGVCDRCQHHTTGHRCEQCEDGYYRPEDVPPEDEKPCRRCQCGSGPGVSRLCVKDDGQLIEGRRPGDCLCREGFEGPRCERCAPGHRNYPRCEQCSCVHAGISNAPQCDGPCQCKKNVEGTRCNRCRDRYYNLAADNPDGCSQCYCFGATDKCQPSDWGVELVRTPVPWKVTDVPGSFRLEPIDQGGKYYEIANDDVPDHAQDLYYWEAPADYLGQNLYSYGNALKYIVKYVIVRGDTSGRYTDYPDVILEGGPDQARYGFRLPAGSIGNGDHDDSDELNATVVMPLREQNWFRVDDEGRPIPDSAPSRQDFALLLHDLRRLMVRAKYHTDQVSGGLYQAALERASNASASVKKAHGTEQCHCPPGYAGLSCERCQPGYRRVDNILVNGRCELCRCHGHAESCDPYTGECSACLHNTTGPECGQCRDGFYGDATRGQPDDCKPCACPLPDPGNNFSPRCEADPSARHGYRCLDCPEGYTGERCELCANGYFGNPLVPGGFCAPCDCGPNADTSVEGYCDRLTGQCLRCRDNVTGWKCDQCLADHWGDPAAGDCRPCQCDVAGSTHSQCDAATGQCPCRPNYTGMRCDHCAPGYGNLAAGCPACACNVTGALEPDICDELTGQCQCKPGVFGPRCDQCLEGHFGFGPNGCQWCNCDKLGAEGPDCDENTGQCQCRPWVTGRDCSHCQPGYWNLASGRGCQPCNCNLTGSYDDTCDELTGQCRCKPGVTGLHCDQCLPGYFGFGSEGCARCEPCTAPGHICDPKSGRCVCPPNTAGPTCRDCAPGTWGHDVLTGCQSCDCELQGAINNECHHRTGECRCLDGFEGRRCERCKFGYYRFPNCRRCDCHEPGTDPSACRPELGLCQCDETGQCPCRAQVTGRRCDQCRESAFALTADNPLGCFGCFCFGKSNQCQQSTMVWTELGFPPRQAHFVVGHTDLRTVLGFRLIPDGSADTSVGVADLAQLAEPFYWAVPDELLNDRVLSYNGHLQFRAVARGSAAPVNSVSRMSAADTRRRFPLVVLQGNHRLVLHHHGPEQGSATGLYRVRLHESQWIWANNPEYPVTREVMMVALQNVQHLLIRASHGGGETSFVRLSELTVEVARPGGLGPRPATGVEQCRCPPQYAESSCQDPAPGYCRKRKPNYLESKDLLDLVGWAEPCACNNHSRTCDKETCECLDCQAFTAGPQCNLCLRGYYGDPTRGIPCRKCACPTLEASFSETCELAANLHDYVCTDCQPGYTGPHCDQCAPGYWGNPAAGGKCVRCHCSPVGSISDECDPRTGQCPCKEGITGHDCSNCPPRHVVTDTGCLNCDDQCTGLLLDDIDFLQSLLQEANLTDVDNLPWTRLLYLARQLNGAQERTGRFRQRVASGQAAVRNFTVVDPDLETLADLLSLRARELARQAPGTAQRAAQTADRAQEVRDQIGDLWQMIQGVIQSLKRHGTDGGDPRGTAADRMFDEAVRLLQELRLADLAGDQRRGQLELKRARYLLDRVRQLLAERGDGSPADQLRDRLARLARLLADIYGRIDRTVYPESREAQRIVARLRPLLGPGREARDAALRHAEAARVSLAEARELLELVRQELYDAQRRYRAVPDLVGQLMNLTDLVERRRSLLARLNPEYEERYVRPCVEHAEALARRVAELGRRFDQTRHVAADPLQAARAYETIVAAVAEAEQAVAEARQAAQRAFGEADLLDQARQAAHRSEQLLHEADQLNHRLRALQQELSQKQRWLAEIEAMVEAARHDLDWINQSLDQLPALGHEVRQLIHQRLQRLLVSFTDTHHRLDELVAGVADLDDQLRGLSGPGGADLDDIKRDVTQSMLLLTRLKEEVVRIETRRGPGNQRQLELSLEELRAKIKLARQKAASIRVSLGADREGVCVRTYEPEVEPSFTNHIVLYYAIKHEQIRDSLLMYLGARQLGNGDFMALEMVDRRIRFVWSTGNTERLVSHPRHILTNDAQLSKDSHWYKIEVKRFGSTANLSVWSVPEARFPDPFEATESSQSEAKRMNLDRDAYFYVGGLPPDLAAGGATPRLLRARHFAGCLYELHLDGKRVGLWNFTSTIGCDGCKEGATEPVDPNLYSFRDEFGYGKLRQPLDYKPSTYLVSFQFRTFDEEALLFFGANPHPERNRDYVALFLRDGRLHYECHFGRPDLSQLLVSGERLNTGQWVTVRAERENELALLELVTEDGRRHTYDSRLAGGHPPLLDLVAADLYFGGVPPNFTLNYAQHYPNVVFRSLVGCLNSPQIDSTAVNLQRAQSFGVEPGCPDKAIRVASFFGNGFLELDGQPLTDHIEFSFTFRTSRKSGLLLLSTFETVPPTSAGIKDEHYYFFYIANGLLEVRLNGGSGESMYRFENVDVADGRYHTVTCIKDQRRFRILIDDEQESTQIRLAKSKVIEAPKRGGLFIGGTPPGYTAINKGYAANFYGVIRDLVFNNKLVSFNQPHRFRGVAIGREGYFPQLHHNNHHGGHGQQQLVQAPIPPPPPVTPLQRLEPLIDRMVAMPAEHFDRSCASDRMAWLRGTEPDARRFEGGGQLLRLDTADGAFFGDFSLSFWFRTFYPNGALMTLARPHHGRPVLAVALVDGQVVLRIKMSERHRVELSSSRGKLNDGQWHYVAASRKKLSLWLNVDHKDLVENNNPKRKLAMKKIVAFIGGLPTELTGPDLATEESQLINAGTNGFLPTTEPFKGCLRQFYINGDHVELTADEDGPPCLAHIERGVYFTGNDSFAVYQGAFNIGLKTDLAFEFRTTRQASQVLFALANGTGETPSLTVELTADGSLVASADLGTGPFRARHRFANRYELCDGRWHIVKVHYSKNSIALRVDRADVVYGLNERNGGHYREPFTEAPLYVGGVPAGAPSGALLTRSPFQGCIRNVQLNEQRKDWLSDVQLAHNVERSACPAAAAF